MRTCFRNHFRLFKGDTDKLTYGRFVRVPTGTPFYPGWHHLLSRDWTSDERNPWPDLGEANTPRAYDSGEPLQPEPVANLIGDSSCLENGENPDDTADSLLNGYPLPCYMPRAWRFVPDIGGRTFATEMARVVSDLYDNNGNAGPRLNDAIGGNNAVVFPTTVGETPSGAIASSELGTFVVLAGTDNLGDLTLQGFLGLPPPTSFGPYSTLPLWQIAALNYCDRIDAFGPDLSKPLFLCGHSYGAAVAAVLATKYRIGLPDRVIILRTFGMPVVGDARMKAILDTVDRQHIANVGDFVCVVPSSHLGVQLNLIAVTAQVLGLLGEWTFQGNQFLLYDTGQLIADDTNNVFQLGNLSAIARSLFDSTPVNPPFTHPIAVYIARLEL